MRRGLMFGLGRGALGFFSRFGLGLFLAPGLILLFALGLHGLHTFGLRLGPLPLGLHGLLGARGVGFGLGGLGRVLLGVGPGRADGVGENLDAQLAVLGRGAHVAKGVGLELDFKAAGNGAHARHELGAAYVGRGWRLAASEGDGELLRAGAVHGIFRQDAAIGGDGEGVRVRAGAETGLKREGRMRQCRA
ncbi:MAG: hypothetical protein AUJ49_13780 [Desulfovibrionaceae bacterium CG1_02_65_16]|nr:MAG: hypothetical protein AUJ49_13780 [Desulfovibrionaceae bacterium CG1_02_65_16]